MQRTHFTPQIKLKSLIAGSSGRKHPVCNRMRISFIARYVYTYESFVFVTEADWMQQTRIGKPNTAEQNE